MKSPNQLYTFILDGSLSAGVTTQFDFAVSTFWPIYSSVSLLTYFSCKTYYFVYWQNFRLESKFCTMCMSRQNCQLIVGYNGSTISKSIFDSANHTINKSCLSVSTNIGYKCSRHFIRYQRPTLYYFSIYFQKNFRFIQSYLMAFDLDVVQLCYNGSRVLSTWAAMNALSSGKFLCYCLTRDIESLGKTALRLSKYIRRGFTFLFPHQFPMAEFLALPAASCNNPRYTNRSSLNYQFGQNNDTFCVQKQFVEFFLDRSFIWHLIVNWNLKNKNNSQPILYLTQEGTSCLTAYSKTRSETCAHPNHTLLDKVFMIPNSPICFVLPSTYWLPFKLFFSV